jgi:hypothetical protein
VTGFEPATSSSRNCTAEHESGRFEPAGVQGSPSLSARMRAHSHSLRYSPDACDLGVCRRTRTIAGGATSSTLSDTSFRLESGAPRTHRSTTASSSLPPYTLFTEGDSYWSATYLALDRRPPGVHAAGADGDQVGLATVAERLIIRCSSPAGSVVAGPIGWFRAQSSSAGSSGHRAASCRANRAARKRCHRGPALL